MGLGAGSNWLSGHGGKGAGPWGSREWELTIRVEGREKEGLWGVPVRSAGITSSVSYGDIT